MADTTITFPRAPSSMPAVAGASVGAAACAIAIFHGNELLLHWGLTPIPTEIAADYQILFAALGGIVTHRLGIN